MNSITPLIYTAAIVLSGVVAHFLSRLLIDEEHKSSRRITSAVIFLLLLGLTRMGIDGYFNRPIDIDKALQEEELMIVFKQAEPAAYAGMVSKLEMLQEQKRLPDRTDIITIGQTQVGKVIQRRLATVTATTRSRYLDALITQLNYLYDQGGTACYAVIFPSSATLPSHDILQKSMEQSGLKAALIAVLKDPANRAAPADNPTIQQTLQETLEAIQKKFDNITLLTQPQTAKNDAEKRKVCSMTAAFYEYLNDLKNSKKTATLQWLFSNMTN